jgi:tRNA(fMet)-specific endonuclease VapC
MIFQRLILMTDYLLDTNVVIARLKNDSSVIKMLRSAQSIAIPAGAVCERFYGAEKSGRVSANLKQVEEFLVGRTILVCDLETAREYGRVAQKLRTKGRPIRHNDVWIAAVALQHKLTVLSKDAHFNDVDGLVQGW